MGVALQSPMGYESPARIGRPRHYMATANRVVIRNLRAGRYRIRCVSRDFLVSLGALFVVGFEEELQFAWLGVRPAFMLEDSHGEYLPAYNPNFLHVMRPTHVEVRQGQIIEAWVHIGDEAIELVQVSEETSTDAEMGPL